MSEPAETIQDAQIAPDASGMLADDAARRGDELEDWFAQAATGEVPDAGDSPGRVLLAAATLPVHDAMVRPSRPRRRLLRASGVTRLWRVRGGVLGMTVFASLTAFAVVTAATTRLPGSSSTSSPMPEIVTTVGTSLNKLGAAVESSLTVTVARQKRAGQRRRAALQADEDKANEWQARVNRRMLVARHRANVRAHAAVPARAFAPTTAGRGASSQARVAPAQMRQRSSVPRRSICGPFDLC